MLIAIRKININERREILLVADWDNICEVYARSFQDSNDDGIGDLEGIIQGLEYLQWLGVTTVWLTPVYPSPMKDLGYDISDFQNIDPLFWRSPHVLIGYYMLFMKKA